MAERFNLRVLHVPTVDDVARAVAQIENVPERVAATAPKGNFLVIHAAGLPPVAATILKQELLALDADCVISPAVYLGDRETPTDTLIMATLRQYQAPTVEVWYQDEACLGLKPIRRLRAHRGQRPRAPR